MKQIDIQISTKYRLFQKVNVKKKLINAVDDINWSLEKKSICFDD